MPDNAVHVCDGPTLGADDVMMVVAHSPLVERGRPCRLDASGETRRGQVGEDVVHRLDRSGRQRVRDDSEYMISIRVRHGFECVEHRDPASGCAQTAAV